MFKKQYVSLFKPHALKSKSNIEHKVISKRDEEKIKNIIKEQPKVREMINTSLQHRNDFLRSQKIINYQYEKSRLQGLESRVVGNLRYYAPPIKIDDFPTNANDPEYNRMKQLDRIMDQELIKHKGPDFYTSRYF